MLRLSFAELSDLASVESFASLGPANNTEGLSHEIALYVMLRFQNRKAVDPHSEVERWRLGKGPVPAGDRPPTAGLSAVLLAEISSSLCKKAAPDKPSALRRVQKRRDRLPTAAKD